MFSHHSISFQWIQYIHYRQQWFQIYPRGVLCWKFTSSDNGTIPRWTTKWPDWSSDISGNTLCESVNNNCVLLHFQLQIPDCINRTVFFSPSQISKQRLPNSKFHRDDTVIQMLALICGAAFTASSLLGALAITSDTTRFHADKSPAYGTRVLTRSPKILNFPSPRAGVGNLFRSACQNQLEYVTKLFRVPAKVCESKPREGCPSV